MVPTRLFAYFRQRYEGRVEIGPDGAPYQVLDPRGGYADERLHLAVSEDGRRFTPLNDGRPVWDRWLRDPFLERAPDGVWHLVGTTRTRGCILHATSRDLRTWEGEDVPVLGSLGANNAWAPEWVWDDAAGEFFVFWSSSFEREGWMRSRLYACRTRDWQTFSPPTLLFAPPYSAIDGSLLHQGGRWWMFHKEEEFGPETGERRAIRLAVADRLDGPYETVGEPVAPTITEGPCVAPDPQGSGWLLYYDFCMADGYGLARSEDLMNWKTVSDHEFPEGARHGSVSVLGPTDVRWVEAQDSPSAPSTPGMLDAKLQIKPGKSVAVLDAPFEVPLEAAPADVQTADAVIAFVRNQAELDGRAGLFREVVGRGGMAWVAYPKAKALGTDLNRDTIHAWGKTEGLETVRQIAIDETWSGMRLKAAG